MQLDRHHLERLEADREQAKERNEILTKGLSNIAEAIEYLAVKDELQTIEMIGDTINRLFDLSDSDDVFETESKAICRLSSEFDDADESMSFEDITSVTVWWKSNFPSGRKFDSEIAVPEIVNDEIIQKKLRFIANLLAVTKQLELYWMSKLLFLLQLFESFKYLKL